MIMNFCNLQKLRKVTSFNFISVMIMSHDPKLNSERQTHVCSTLRKIERLMTS